MAALPPPCCRCHTRAWRSPPLPPWSSHWSRRRLYRHRRRQWPSVLERAFPRPAPTMEHAPCVGVCAATRPGTCRAVRVPNLLCCPGLHVGNGRDRPIERGEVDGERLVVRLGLLLQD